MEETQLELKHASIHGPETSMRRWLTQRRRVQSQIQGTPAEIETIRYEFQTQLKEVEAQAIHVAG
jgi:hypothetical protein